MLSDKEKAEELCNLWQHQWKEGYYGYTCENCGMFIPYGCEPWMPLDDYSEDDWEWGDDDSFWD